MLCYDRRIDSKYDYWIEERWSQAKWNRARREQRSYLEVKKEWEAEKEEKEEAIKKERRQCRVFKWNS